MVVIFRGPSLAPLVYDLKFVGPLEIKFAAPMPEQTKTTTMHFLDDSRKKTLANFSLGLLTPQGNALLWSQFVLAWVQRISNFGSSE